jgi:hypothetical protein
MDWFNRLSTLHDKSVFRKDAIDRGLSVYWNSLVAMVEAGQKEFQARYGTGPAAALFTTSYASGTEPFLRRTEGGVNHDVTLKKHDSRISGNFSDPIAAVILQVILDDNGCPVLQCENRRISIDEACEKIVRPILFPDLI